MLRLLDAFLWQAWPSTSVDAITPDLLDAFLSAARRHRRPRSLQRAARRRPSGCSTGWSAQESPSAITARPGQAPAGRPRQAHPVPRSSPRDARRLLDLAGLAAGPRSRAPTRGANLPHRCSRVHVRRSACASGEVSRLTCARTWTSTAPARHPRHQVRQDEPGPLRPAARGSCCGTVRSTERRARIEPEAPLFSFTKRGPRASRARSARPSTSSCRKHGPPVPVGVAPPRLHDLRHAFAVGTLLRWYREGVDPATRLFHLATFLGHVRPELHGGVPHHHAELLAEANRRFEGFAAPAPDGGAADDHEQPLGPLVQSFFLDGLMTMKGLRPSSVRSYRDAHQAVPALRRRPTRAARSRASPSPT